MGDSHPACRLFLCLCVMALFVLAALAACGSDEPTGQRAGTPTPGSTFTEATPTPAVPAPTPRPTATPAEEVTEQPDRHKRIEEAAPVESVDIAISGGGAEIVLVTGLPDGCYKYGRYSIDESAPAIVVSVFNLRVADRDIACIAVYETVAEPQPADWTSHMEKTGVRKSVRANKDHPGHWAGVVFVSPARELWTRR